MKEIQPGAHSNEELPQKGRRSFLSGIVAGAAGLYLGNKYIEKEQEINNFYKRFEGKEENYEIAAEAALMLMSEMKMSNLDHVSFSGTGHPNDRIEILRTYLTRHLNKKGVGDKYPFQKQIINNGSYTKESLASINDAAMYFAHPHVPQNPQTPQQAQDYSRGEV